jgi:hypothetical protein
LKGDKDFKRAQPVANMAPSRTLPRGSSCVAVAFVLLLSAPVAAHVPVLPSEAHAWESAHEVPDPFKSRALFGTLEAGRPQYFSFDVRRLEPLFLQVLGPPSATGSGLVLVLAGPGLGRQGSLPEGVSLPPNVGWMVVAADPEATAEIEPFSPIALRTLLLVRPEPVATGVHYAVLRSPTPLAFSFAIGEEESFSPTEWVLVPAFTPQIYAWSGQAWWEIAVAPVLVLAIGTALVARPRFAQRWKDPLIAGSTVAALLFFAAAALTTYQWVRAIALSSFTGGSLITLGFVAVGLGLGWLCLRPFLRPGLTIRSMRTGAAIAFIAGLVATVGFLVAPVAAFVAAVLPRQPATAAKREQAE